MPPAGPSRLAWRRFRHHRTALLGLAVLVVESAVALLAPYLISPDLALRPQPAIILKTPSVAHPLGTDEAGRDILARPPRAISGTRGGWRWIPV